MRGIEVYKQMLTACVSETAGALAQSLCTSYGPFLHLPLAPVSRQRGALASMCVQSVEVRQLCSAHMLVMFGRFFLRVFMSTVSVRVCTAHVCVAASCTDVRRPSAAHHHGMR